MVIMVVVIISTMMVLLMVRVIAVTLAAQKVLVQFIPCSTLLIISFVSVGNSP